MNAPAKSKENSIYGLRERNRDVIKIKARLMPDRQVEASRLNPSGLGGIQSSTRAGGLQAAASSGKV